MEDSLTNPQAPLNPPVATVPVDPMASTQAVSPPPVKKGFPPVLLFLLGAILLAVVGYFVFKVFNKSTSSSKEITLTWWGLWEDESIISPLISEYQTANPNVKIKFVKQSKQDYRERLTNAFAKGTGPDIFRFHNTWVPMFKNNLDYLPASVMSAGEFAQTFYPVATSDLTSGTGLVGIPLEYEALSFFINEDLFAKAGKTVPKTWDEVRQTAKDLTTKDELGRISQSGIALGRTENVDHWQDILTLMMLQNGVNLAAPTGQLAEDALTFFSLFSTTDGVWDETMPSSTTAFAAGKVAMYFGPTWRVFEIKEQNPQLNLRAVAVPQLPKTSAGEADVVFASYWAEGVWVKSKNKLAAWNFLKFLSTKESLQKFYQNASRTRLFGEPYPRVDMANLLSTDPILSVVISQAPNAQSWYVASNTWDGATGINTQITKYFEDAVNSVNQGIQASRALQTVASGVNQVLTQYGLTTQ